MPPRRNRRGAPPPPPEDVLEDIPERADLDDYNDDSLKKDGGGRTLILENDDNVDSEGDHGYAADATNGLSKEKLIYEINKAHPRKYVEDENGNGRWEKHNCCTTSTGCFSIRASTRKSELSDYGSGSVLYF